LEKAINSGSILRMDVLSPQRLAELDDALDLFEATPAIDDALLERGLHPPLPVSGDLLVWGFALIRRAARSGIPGLPVRRLPPLPDGELLALALRLEGRPGAYSWGELENLLRFARRGGAPSAAGEAIDLASLSPLIEGHPDPRLEDRIERFMGLPAVVKEAVAGGRLELKIAELAAELPEEALERVVAAPLSFSDRRRFISMLLEVARRDGVAAGALPKLVRGLLERPDPVRALGGLRQPTLAALQARFAALGEELWKGTGVRVDAPPSFEGDGFSVSFRFANPDALDRRLRALHRVAEHAHELFALLR
jgi:hypothetical protein